MATVSFVRAFRPRPGRRQDFLKMLARGKKIHERLGAKVRCFANAAGEPGTIIHVVETSSWKAFGEYREKLSADSDFQTLQTEIASTKEPAADLVRMEVVEELLLD